jgi:hypothetical protein
MYGANTGRAPNGHRHAVSVVLAAVGCAVAIAACGSSSKSSNAGASGGPLLKLAECMRSHRVPNFPDPGANGGGLLIPNDINTQAPAFQSAQKACASLGSGGSGPGSSSESREVAMFALAKCMRKHGVPNFPDPTHSPPPPGSGNVIGSGGVYLALGPGGSSQSPAFKRAAAACGFRLP